MGGVELAQERAWPKSRTKVKVSKRNFELDSNEFMRRIDYHIVTLFIRALAFVIGLWLIMFLKTFFWEVCVGR